jgi:hypothetical protein
MQEHTMGCCWLMWRQRDALGCVPSAGGCQCDAWLSLPATHNPCCCTNGPSGARAPGVPGVVKVNPHLVSPVTG